ncbi:hypothetical protein ACA910_014126 [Epithemia clementina (nom. ined.)]
MTDDNLTNCSNNAAQQQQGQNSQSEEKKLYAFALPNSTFCIGVLVFRIKTHSSRGDNGYGASAYELPQAYQQQPGYQQPPMYEQSYQQPPAATTYPMSNAGAVSYPALLALPAKDPGYCAQTLHPGMNRFDNKQQ